MDSEDAQTGFGATFGGIEKYRQAGEITAQALEYGKSIIKKSSSTRNFSIQNSV